MNGNFSSTIATIPILSVLELGFELRNLFCHGLHLVEDNLEDHAFVFLILFGIHKPATPRNRKYRDDDLSCIILEFCLSRTIEIDILEPSPRRPSCPPLN